MKKKRLIVLTISFILLFSGIAYASSILESIKVYRNYYNLYVNGKKVTSDNFNYKNNNYVQLREISEKLNCNIQYNDSTKTADINSINNKTIDMSNATCKIYTTLNNGNTSSGSGWFIDSTHIVTAHHVVCPQNGFYVTKMWAVINSNTVVKCQYINSESTIDMAIIETINYNSSKYFDYDLDNIQANEVLISYSYPMDTLTCLTEAHVAKEVVSSDYLGKMFVLWKCTRQNVINGSSGGVITRNGKAVGMMNQCTVEGKYVLVSGIHQIKDEVNYILKK